MNKEQILKAIKNLANNNLYYKVFYIRLTNGSDESKMILEELEDMKFNNATELDKYLYKNRF